MGADTSSGGNHGKFGGRRKLSVSHGPNRYNGALGWGGYRTIQLQADHRFASSDADWIGGGTSVDEITDFTHGIDHINLEFVPTSILTGSSTDLTDAIGDARELMIAHAGYKEVAIIQVGSDSYLVSSGAGMSDFADLVIELNGVNASAITAADFI